MKTQHSLKKKKDPISKTKHKKYPGPLEFYLHSITSRKGTNNPGILNVVNNLIIYCSYFLSVDPRDYQGSLLLPQVWREVWVSVWTCCSISGPRSQAGDSLLSLHCLRIKGSFSASFPLGHSLPSPSARERADFSFLFLLFFLIYAFWQLCAVGLSSSQPGKGDRKKA